MKAEVEIGAAWKKTSKAENNYIQLRIDAPFLPGPIFANLVGGDLHWTRFK